MADESGLFSESLFVGGVIVKLVGMSGLHRISY